METPTSKTASASPRLPEGRLDFATLLDAHDAYSGDELMAVLAQSLDRLNAATETLLGILRAKPTPGAIAECLAPMAAEAVKIGATPMAEITGPIVARRAETDMTPDLYADVYAWIGHAKALSATLSTVIDLCLILRIAPNGHRLSTGSATPAPETKKAPTEPSPVAAEDVPISVDPFET